MLNTLFQTVNTQVNQFILRSEGNAVGRLSLYRILYAAFYLWMIARYDLPILSSIPTGELDPLITLFFLDAQPAPEFYMALQFILVFGLVMLLFGTYVRSSIIMIIASGTIIAMLRYSFGKIDHYDTFMVLYTPLVMLFYSGWGNNYSFDAIIKQRKGIKLLSPNESSWQYSWPIMIITVLLTILFIGAGVLKLLPDSNSWLWHTDIIRKLTIDFNKGLSPNPLTPFIVDNAWIYGPLRFGAVIFEAGFFLALINNKWRSLFMATAVFFHLFNLILFGIPFVDMLIIYAIFVDWQKLYERFVPQMVKSGLKQFFYNIPTVGLIILSLSIASLIALLWLDFDSPVRQFFHAVPYELAWIIAGIASLLAFSESAYLLTLDAIKYIKTWRQNSPTNSSMKKTA